MPKQKSTKKHKKRRKIRNEGKLKVWKAMRKENETENKNDNQRNNINLSTGCLIAKRIKTIYKVPPIEKQ